MSRTVHDDVQNVIESLPDSLLRHHASKRSRSKRQGHSPHGGGCYPSCYSCRKLQQKIQAIDYRSTKSKLNEPPPFCPRCDLTFVGASACCPYAMPLCSTGRSRASRWQVYRRSSSCADHTQTLSRPPSSAYSILSPHPSRINLSVL